MTTLILAVSFAIVVSFFCSLFEAVFYAVPMDYLESQAQQGRRSGKLLQMLRRDVQKPISAILITNTTAMTASGAIAGASAAEVFGPNHVTAFSLVFSIVFLIVSEVLPKVTGVVHCRPLAKLIARPLHILVKVLKPFVSLCDLFIRLVFRGRNQEHTTSDEELIVMARLGMQVGSIDADEADVIENILELEKQTVREVMTPWSVTFALDADLTVSEARQEDGILSHSRIPVYGDEPQDLVGIVHRRHVLGEVAKDRPDTTLEQLMRPVYFVADATPLNELLTLFIERRQHLFVAIDEFGTVVGIVTLEDVLEEILGREIVDESDGVEDPRDLATKRREELLRDQEGESEE